MSTASTSALKDASVSSLKQRAGEAARPHTTKSGHNHDHQHDHGLFGHAHSHSHAGDTEEAAALAAAFSGAGDKGSRIILLGLASNIFLTVAKGVGGYMLHSASLLADAGHSLSDLLGDIVVLFSWRLSRRPASRGFQYGYGVCRLSKQLLTTC
jgi:Co/Zn/Cd efflux system component